MRCFELRWLEKADGTTELQYRTVEETTDYQLEDHPRVITATKWLSVPKVKENGN